MIYSTTPRMAADVPDFLWQTPLPLDVCNPYVVGRQTFPHDDGTHLKSWHWNIPPSVCVCNPYIGLTGGSSRALIDCANTWQMSFRAFVDTRVITRAETPAQLPFARHVINHVMRRREDKVRKEGGRRDWRWWWRTYRKAAFRRGKKEYRSTPYRS